MLDRWLAANKGKSVLWATSKDLKAWLFDAPANVTTRNHYRQAAVAFYAFCADVGYIEANVALGLPRLKAAKPTPKALSVTQAHAVEQAAKLHPLVVQVLVLLYLYVGLRRSAVRLLEWREVDLEGGWVRHASKGGGERIKPLAPVVIDALKRWRTECPDPQWVFPSEYGKIRGRPLSNTWVYSVIRAVGRDAGIDNLHPHQLRHSFATRMLEKGAHIRQVQELLDHASLQTTQIYLTVRPTNLRDVVNTLDYGEEDDD